MVFWRNAVRRAVFFFVGVTILSRIQERLSADVESNTVTVADYAVRVENLPADTTTQELREFFSVWGTVHSTELVKTDCELIERARIDKAIAENVRVSIARAARQATKVGIRFCGSVDWMIPQRPNGKISLVPLVRIKIQEKRQERAGNYTRNLYTERQSAKVVCAFVTMESAQQRIDVLNAYPKSFGRRLFMRRDRRFRNRYRIKVFDNRLLPYHT